MGSFPPQTASVKSDELKSAQSPASEPQLALQTEAASGSTMSPVLDPPVMSDKLDCAQPQVSEPPNVGAVSEDLAGSIPEGIFSALSPKPRELLRQPSLASSYMDALSDAESSTPTLLFGPSEQELPHPEQELPPQIVQHQPAELDEATSSLCILRSAHDS